MNGSEGAMNLLFQDGGLLLGEADGRVYFVDGGKSYWLSDYPGEPCLYVKGPDGVLMTVHQSFTVDQLCRAARRGGTMTMITGDEYDIRGVLMLLKKAVGLGMDSVDISYVEGRCFMDFLEERGAASPETAADLAGAGLKNPNAMNPFLHAGKVARTADGRFYLKKPGRGGAPKADDEGCSSRLISNLVRFGCGCRMHRGRRQYYAWHGVPSRNDDYITYAEITAAEYERIGREYPCELDADRETADRFRAKYVDGHPVLREGWNVSL